MRSEQTPVLIVGAGLAGLTTALFLGQHGVPAIVADRHPGTANQPKARGQSPTIMEAFRAAGVADAIRAAAPPGRPEMTIVICDSVTGTVRHSYSEQFPDFAALSPAPAGLASQQAAEAAIAARAAELGADLRFRTVLETMRQDGDGVTATLHDLGTDQRYQVRADYLVGADGGRGTVARAAGVGHHGRGPFGHVRTVLFRADELIDEVPDTAILMYYVQNPALPTGAASFVSTDRPGEYVLGINDDEHRTDEETIELIRITTGRPELKVELCNIGNTWEMAHRVADRFSAGRVHLVGDAAHLMPPTGGQGGNTAMLDGIHLAWKLAAVVQGQAGPGLLDSHDAEQRPYGQTIADWQYVNRFERLHPDERPDDLPEVPGAVDCLFGYRMASRAVVGDTGEYGFEPATGRPGSRAPHVVLHRDGAVLSTRDLFFAGFVLLTEDPGWVEAAARVAGELAVPLAAHRIGAELTDDGTFRASYGLPDGGAVLVRPDGVVGWRCTTGADAAALGAAWRQILDR
ncbi:FAD-dependent oxidoreductase [Actinocatenispora thailandica]|uniref:FAD-dependent oxidoreductase n=1 Tax=Actinocatenispora thailandica TaxID=227318 RepID=A0A7R7DSR2_9ACTN|nr:FAD-dependent monooxygenase [Actinocatenispora thailandica]BCJ36965.1 FAD-dependent oxidoreductase [Actinocatenispora thailandica]